MRAAFRSASCSDSRSIAHVLQVASHSACPSGCAPARMPHSDRLASPYTLIVSNTVTFYSYNVNPHDGCVTQPLHTGRLPRERCTKQPRPLVRFATCHTRPVARRPPARPAARSNTRDRHAMAPDLSHTTRRTVWLERTCLLREPSPPIPCSGPSALRYAGIYRDRPFRRSRSVRHVR